jgi:hypothetical protein
MKLKSTLLASAVLASSMSLSAQVAHPPVQDGSVSSRAPLPANRPYEYVRVKTADGSQPAQSALIATHIDAPTPDQPVAVGEPVAPAAQDTVVTTTTTETVLTPTGRPDLSAGASLDANQIGSEIRSGATAAQERLRDIEARVKASGETMATTRSTMTTLTADNQTQFDSANNAVKATEKALQKSIKAARNSTGEQVATDYEAYAAAVARVEVIASAQR